MLIYGADDTTLQPLFNVLLRGDPLYGTTDRYLTLQGAYLEGNEPQTCDEFLDLFRANVSVSSSQHHRSKRTPYACGI